MNDRYIAAKERWAAKMARKAKPSVRSTDRLPPGQHEVRNFPMLDLGLRPEVTLDQWELKISGKVENPVTLNWKEFMALPQFEDVSDFHCVTTWSQYDMRFQGVAFFTLADLVKPKPEAAHVYFKSYDGYSTNNPLDVCLDDDVMIAHSWNVVASVASVNQVVSFTADAGPAIAAGSAPALSPTPRRTSPSARAAAR